MIMAIARHRRARAIAPHLAARSDESEWLDRPDIPRDELVAVLRDLDRFNGAMLGQWPIVRWVERALNRIDLGEPVTVLDVGCGSGGLLRAIRHAARRSGRDVALIGVDLSADTIAIAKAQTPREDEIRYLAADVFRYRPETPIDLIVSGLVAHHLPDSQIVDLLRWMDNTAQRGWLISDLQRSVVPYAFIGLIGNLTRIHPTVIHDGRISVARSLTRAEWRARVHEAGLAGVSIRWMLYRWLVSHVKDANMKAGR
jgi:SAM-dependent methyltransferase